MVDLHKVVLKALSLPLGLLLHSNHLLCLCVILAGSALCLPFHSVFFVSFAALFTLLASHRSAPPRLPRYQGSLDVLLGRSYRASSDTPEMEARCHLRGNVVPEHVSNPQSSQRCVSHPVETVCLTCRAVGMCQRP